MGSIFAFLLIAAAWPTIRWQPWVSGLEAPVDLQSPRDGSGRMFAVEQRGRVRLIRNGAVVSTPVLDITAKVQYGGEMGLLGLAFPPGFRDKQYFYLNYVDRQRRTIVARYRISGDTADPASEEVLLTIPQPFDNHNGGCIQFSPRDGQLYIGMGDGGSGGDPQNRAQNPASQLGKMLRMDVENGARTAQTWALGLRNPWRFSFDRATGDMYIADVGQNEQEEIDFQPADAPAGLNYGWNLVEGTRCFADRNCATRTGLTAPIFVYGRNDGVSVSGGYVYRGAAFPFLTGIYFFGDYGSGQIWGTRRDGANWETQKLINPDLPVVAFGEDEAGELYMVAHNGRILKLDATPPAAAVNAVVNAASFAPALAPGAIASAFLNPVADPSALTVRVNSEPATVFYAGTNGTFAQVNFHIPGATPTGPATFTINGAELRASLAETAPGVFGVIGAGVRGQPVEIYATGIGKTPSAVSVQIAGRPATVLYAGPAPGFLGLDQVNAVVPPETPVGDAELILRAGAAASPAVRLPVR
jgi:uncharacterized protein (TIGR03437 family)